MQKKTIAKEEGSVIALLGIAIRGLLGVLVYLMTLGTDCKQLTMVVTIACVIMAVNMPTMRSFSNGAKIISSASSGHKDAFEQPSKESSR